MPTRAHRIASNTELRTEEAFWHSLHESGSRRRSPRVHANIVVHLMPKGVSIIKSRTNDLSFHGMLIECSREESEVLQKQTRAGTKQKPVVFPVSLHLDVDGMSLHAGAHARIAHITLDPDAPAETAVAIGFSFENYEDGTQHVLYRFVIEQMRPDP